MKSPLFALIAATSLLPCTALAQATPPAAPAPAPTDGDVIPGDILFDSRVRYEGVSQDGLTDADALTARVRFGWQSPVVSKLRFLIEGEAVEALVDDYNDTIHGPATRAIVADPEAFELNRLQVTWTGLPDTEVTLGRQRVILGNARFVGNVGFRQNEQTFDALKVTTTAFNPFSITYAYIDRVHRVFGDDSPVGEWRSDSHIVNVDTPTPAGKLSVYGFWLDFENAATQSSATYGARLAGDRPLTADWKVNWTLEYARQSDYGNNPATFDLDYSLLSAGLSHGPFSVTLAREDLDGNGSRGFQTPLATLHAFQGWADVFLTTPAGGLTDESVALGYTWSTPPVGRSVTFNGSWRTFSSSSGLDYGDELDASARLVVNPHWAVEVKAAQFDGTGTFADRDKIWAAIEYRF